MVKTQLRSPSRILPYYSPQRSKKESALMRKRRLQVAKGMVWGKNGCVWKWERILFVAAPVPSSWIKWVEVGTNVLWFLYIYVYIYIHLMFSPMGWICWVESSKDCPKDSASGWSAQPWGVRGFSGDRRYTKIFWGFHKWRSPHFMDGLWWNILLNPFNTYFSMDDLGVPPHDLGKHLKNGGDSLDWYLAAHH